MSCYTCLKKFSLFTREYSCSNCGLSYCNKCLKEKVQLGGLKKNVCNNCHKKLFSNSESMASSNTDIPDLLMKRLETLENPARPPITVFRHSNRLMNLKSGLSSKDKEILERLEKLKAERVANVLPDENEIKRRLALLQDRSEESTKESSKSYSLGSKSQEEEVDELLKQYMSECALNANFENTNNQAIDNIKERLKTLQMSEDSAEAENKQSAMELEDDDGITAKLIQRAIAEGELERKIETSRKSEIIEENESDDNYDEDDENSEISDEEGNECNFKWCLICNENATIKCYDCDKNLYCDSCFKQGHEFFNMDNHKYVVCKKNLVPDGQNH